MVSVCVCKKGEVVWALRVFALLASLAPFGTIDNHVWITVDGATVFVFCLSTEETVCGNR